MVTWYKNIINKLNIRKVCNEIRIGPYEKTWYTGWKDKNFRLTYETTGYDDGYANLSISLFGWHSLFRLPWKSKRYPYGDCDAPTYGIYFFEDAITFCYGGDGNLDGGSRQISWYLPILHYVFIKHEVECKDGNEIYMEDSTNLEYQLDKNSTYIPLNENPKVNVKRTYFKDPYDGELIYCTYFVETREWRPKWLTWTKLFQYVKKTIDIQFDKEVGSGKGSWKGGTVGCSYIMNPGETAEQCIGRMQKDKEFFK